MKNLKKVKFAVIGGTGFEKLFKDAKETRIRTPYGAAPPMYVGKVEDRKVAFLHRHGPKHLLPPHKINYRANIYALHKLGVERVLAVNAVGAINQAFKPGDMVVPNDFVDFTKLRNTTFYDKAPVTHIDVSSPYCPEIRKLLIDVAKKMEMRTWDRAVLVCTEGPRFETPAEIEVFRRLGCDVVGMTGVPEVVLARELEMCYASLCFVSNMAAGIQERLTPSEVSKISRQIMPKMEKILIETLRVLPFERGKNCSCGMTLEDARLK